MKLTSQRISQFGINGDILRKAEGGRGGSKSR